MLLARVLDVMLVLLLVAYLVAGFRGGFARTFGSLLGVVAGAIVAFLVIPLLVPLIPAPTWRLAATVAAAVLLIVGGHAAGLAVGRAARRRVKRRPLAVVDRLLGAVIGLVTAALASSLVLGSLGAVGAPLVSQATAGSWVLQAIDRVTPGPVQSALARVRAAVLETGLPRIGDALGGVTNSPGVPDVDTSTPGYAAAARSVVRIGGTAFACGQNQSGSGFVVSPERVVTNAHVVAGVDAPVVESPDGQALAGRVVLFDPAADLAVIAVDGLTAEALELAVPLEPGDQAAVDGYPYGGPFVTGPAEVLAVSTEQVLDIYGADRTPREVYTLAAVVEPGNSGGPLVTEDGRVAGVVFAENADDPELGYATTDVALAPVAQAAAGLTQPVGTGQCTRG